ncbi:MAG: hypothetical protein H8D23_00370, partial [Candidatus Brocadiales bacterium]|nr:hypothetical protein [Candidatus Brocadiales bacterium]
MGLFDALLGQDGVNLVGGGLVGAPDDKMMETRFDEAGNAYQADVRAPLHPGHTTESSQRFGNIPKVEQPIEPSNLNYGDNYYSDTSFVPQNVAPTNNLVGTNTGVQTQHGRDIYQTDTGENVSEKSVTVPVNGKWVNAPSIHGGVRFTEDQVAQGIMSGQIQPTSVHDDLQEAVSVAQARSNNIQTNPMDLYNRQGRVDYIPQPMSFGRGGEEFVAQNQQATIAPWQPEQTDYTNARDVMSAYQGGERLAQRDTGTFQDLTPLEGFLIKADPSKAMEMLAMFKKEGRALTDLQFEKAMDSLGMSDILSEHRSTLNTVDKHYQDSVYGNTDDFGNPLNTDDFGNANYDQRVDNYANSLNNMTGINDVERVANVAKQPSSPSWLQKNQDITRQSQDFVRNLGGNIAEGATDFYEGAKELGSDAYQGAQDLYSDFYKPDTRTQMEKWQDAEDVSESIRTGITKGVGITKDLFMRGDEVVEKGFETAGDVLGPLASNWRSNLEKDTNVNPYVPGKDVLKQANVNFFDSTKTSLGDVADSVANPKQSLQGIADISSGALQHVLPDSMSWNEDDKAIASEVGKQIKEDWTTAEGFQKMLAERPVEVIPAFYGAGILSRMGVDKTRDVLNDPRLLDNVEKMSMAIDPTNLGPSSQAVPGGIHPETKIDELGFYSEAENVVNKLKQETNHPDHIRQFMQKNGVTVDEMQDTGLLNYLQNAKANDERVTRTGLLAHIKSNKTKLDETQHVGMG